MSLSKTALFAWIAAGLASAQVPANIAAGLRKIGQVVDPGCTAMLYRPLMPTNDINSSATPLYPGFNIARDVNFGPNPKDLVDIFTTNKGGKSRPVVMYIPGGAGNKIEQQVREANAFYDNIGRWAAQNGMVGILMQRHPGANWDDPGRDVSLMIQWVQANAAKYNANPNRMFLWAQSAGNGPLGTYLGRAELYGPKGAGVLGAIFMSGQFNIAPLDPNAGAARGGPPQAGGNPFGNAGSTCGAGSPNSTAGAIAGPSGAGTPVGTAAPGGGGGGRGPVDPAVQLSRSSLPELKKTKVKMFFITAELDPGINGKMAPFYQVLHDELCKDGPDHCPTMLFGKDQSHMSEVFSIGTADKSVSGPILSWMKDILKKTK